MIATISPSLENLRYSVSPISPGDLVRLRTSVGWPLYTREAAQRSLQHTLFSVGAYENGEFVAYGRVLGDGILNFIIQDVIVVPEYQGKGIGSRVMTQLLAWIKEHAAKNATISLMAARGKEGFYQQFGLEARPTPELGAAMWKRLT